MPNSLSHSSVQMFTTCGRKYDLHYNQKLRSKYANSALLFGAAIDNGLNKLLLTRNLEQGIIAFEQAFKNQTINKVYTYLPTAINVLYTKKDFDKDLLTEEDHKLYEAYKAAEGIQTDAPIEVVLESLIARKKSLGLSGLEDFERSLYSYINWLSLRQKGILMLKAYHDKVLPKIKEVIAVQQSITLENNVGDKVTGFLDLVVVWEDGKRYLMDNKTSSVPYEEDSAGKSPQLVIYFHASKEKYKLDRVGYNVLSKNILKQKTKTCTVCGYVGQGSHKTCNNIVDSKRCGGSWNVVALPFECQVSFVLNDVTEEQVDVVVASFDETNEQIKQGCFEPNFDSCFSYGSPCPYYKYCHDNDSSDLVDMKEHK